jgi:high-affinity iron transporter
VFAGLATALVISATTGWHIAEMADTPLMEGSLAIVAGVLVASLTFVIMKNAKHIKSSITNQMEKHANKTGLGAAAGIFLFTVLMVTREGMETALMLGAVSKQVDATQMVLAALGGVIATAAIGIMWVRHSHLINLRLFMQVTGAFLFLFAVHLFLYGVYELTEVEGTLFYAPDFHAWIKPVASTKTPIGQAIIYSLLIVPCGWLFIAYAKDKLKNQNNFSAAE